MRPPNLPRLGSAATGASVAASPGTLGVSAVSGTGTIPGLTTGGRGGGTGTRVPLLLCQPVVKNVAAATMEATKARTANATKT